jgi:serine/threonine protein kinase
MAYLHEVKVIHGDLAARNVLLSSEMTAKINDFGLSKQCYSYRGYVRSKEKQIPWRSMAPECFSGKIYFSFESDVWAYGVTLWEIFTVGDTPYSHLDAPDERFVYSLKNGMNPGRPDYAPNEIYEIMQSCWKLEPKQRYTFKEIVHKLEAFRQSLIGGIEMSCSGRNSTTDDTVVNIEGPQPDIVPTHLHIVPRNSYQDPSCITVRASEVQR